MAQTLLSLVSPVAQASPELQADIFPDMVLKSLLNLFALGFAVLGGIAGYLANAYWPTGDQEVQGMTPILVAIICGLLPYWSVRLAGDVLSNA
jgi:hypothetical protein